MLWNAWKKGYRIGVIASSDHYSTHISYAMVYTPDTSREAIHNAIRRGGPTARRTTSSWTSVWARHSWGEETASSGPQRAVVRVRGTDEIAAIHLIRDAAYVYKVEPGTQEAEFEYLDVEAGPGDHWYYVRVEQRDGELAWSSPIWISQAP